MKIRCVYALSFSPTGAAEQVVQRIADALAGELGLPCKTLPWTLSRHRQTVQSFACTDLVVVGSPTYAGKLPNKLLPDFQTKLQGSETPAVAVVTFGNRAFDNALAELCAVLEGDGFCPVGGGAFVAEHAFTPALASGRPNDQDLAQMDAFARKLAEKLQDGPLVPVRPSGDPDAPYYIPKGLDGQPAKFLKAKPKTDLERCTGCGLCAQLCPMGSIRPENPAEVPGICIKCHSCVRRCPRQAKYFDDPAFLSHVRMLEQNFARPAQNTIFL